MPSKPKPEKQKHKKRRVVSERKSLEKRLDVLVSTIVILRDGHCVTCGATSGLTCSHFVKREKKLVRWSRENCNAQCASCNLRHNYYPGAYTRYIESHYGLETLHRLQEAEAVNSYKWSMVDLVTLESDLSVELERVIASQTDEARILWARNRVV